MRLIEAAFEIAREVAARGVGVERVDYEVRTDRTVVAANVHFAIGEPLSLVIEMSGPIPSDETLDRRRLAEGLEGFSPPLVH